MSGFINDVVECDELNAAGNVIASDSLAAGVISVQCTNSDNTVNTSDSQVQIAVGGVVGGKPSVIYQISGAAANDWSTGLDNANAYRYCLSEGDVVGTNDALRVAHTTLDVDVVTGNLSVSTGSISANTTVTAGTGVTATTGNIETLAGDLLSSGLVTAGTGISTLAGNIQALAGDISASGSITASINLNSLAGNIAAAAGDVTASGLVSAGTTVAAGTTVTGGTGVVATTGNVAASAGDVTASGAMSAGTTVTAGTGITATTGNIAAAAGNVTASALMDAGTTVTAGTGITATTGNIVATAGAVNAGTSMTATAGDITATNGNIKMSTAGNGFRIPVGANATMGTSGAMVAGVVTVNTTAVTATSRFVLSHNTLGTIALPVALYVSARVAATSFTITSGDVTDTSTIDYIIINEA